LLWQNHARSESLRRLHLAAQHGDTLFFLFRPLAAAQDASPAPLRLSLRPAAGGIEIGVLKRRGPVKDETLFLPLSIAAASPHHQAGWSGSAPVAPITTPAAAPVVQSEVAV
jgi:protein ImuA